MKKNRFQWLNPIEIVLDWSLNPRNRDKAHIRDIARHMNEVGYLEKFPIIVYHLGDKFQCAAGAHRLEAAMLEDAEFEYLPLKEVYCDVRQGSKSDMIRSMLENNFQHTPGFNNGIGKMPSRNEVRDMRYRLLLYPDIFKKADRVLAKQWGCDHKTVGSLRKDIILKVLTGEFSPVDPKFSHIDAANLQEIEKIIADGVYEGLDRRYRPRKTKQHPKPQEKKEHTDEEAGEISDDPKAPSESEVLYPSSDIIKSARKALGRTDLAVATNPEANQVLKAKRFLTSQEEALAQKWVGKVFLSPSPTPETISRFAEKLTEAYQSGDVERAILLIQNPSLEVIWELFDEANALVICRVDSVQSGRSFVYAFYFGDDVSRFHDSFQDIGKSGMDWKNIQQYAGGQAASSLQTHSM